MCADCFWIFAEIDLEHQTAICSTCGLVEIYVYHGPPKYQKSTSSKAKNVSYEENAQFVDDYKRRHKRTCKRCGVWVVNPNEFQFFEQHLPRKQRISSLLWTLDADELIVELEKRDMYCKKCSGIVSNAFRQGVPVPPIIPPGKI
jgi:hypothetical protein